MTNPAFANPKPPREGSLLILAMAMCPQIIPGINPMGINKVSNDETSEATASPEVFGTIGSGGGRSTAGGAA